MPAVLALGSRTSRPDDPFAAAPVPLIRSGEDRAPLSLNESKLTAAPAPAPGFIRTHQKADWTSPTLQAWLEATTAACRTDQ